MSGTQQLHTGSTCTLPPTLRRDGVFRPGSCVSSLSVDHAIYNETQQTCRVSDAASRIPFDVEHRCVPSRCVTGASLFPGRMRMVHPSPPPPTPPPQLRDQSAPVLAPAPPSRWKSQGPQKQTGKKKKNPPTTTTTTTVLKAHSLFIPSHLRGREPSQTGLEITASRRDPFKTRFSLGTDAESFI